MVALLLPWPRHGWLGNPRCGKDLQVWFRKVGTLRQGPAGMARSGRNGQAGRAWQAWRGQLRLSMFPWGAAGMASQGTARPVPAGKAWPPVEALARRCWLGEVGDAERGKAPLARRGRASEMHGMARQVRQRWLGEAR